VLRRMSPYRPVWPPGGQTVVGSGRVPGRTRRVRRGGKHCSRAGLPRGPCAGGGRIRRDADRPNRPDLKNLLEEGLRALGEADSGLRARLLARLAGRGTARCASWRSASARNPNTVAPATVRLGRAISAWRNRRCGGSRSRDTDAVVARHRCDRRGVRRARRAADPARCRSASPIGVRDRQATEHATDSLAHHDKRRAPPSCRQHSTPRHAGHGRDRRSRRTSSSCR